MILLKMDFSVMAASNEEKSDHVFCRSLLSGGLLDEGDEIMVDAGPPARPALRSWAKPLAQACDDEKPARLFIEQLELREEIGPQPQGIDAFVSEVPMRAGGETASAGIVKFHDTGHVFVVVGGKKVSAAFGLEEPENSRNLGGFFCCAAGKQGQEGVEVGKPGAIVGLIHDSPVRDR